MSAQQHNNRGSLLDWHRVQADRAEEWFTIAWHLSRLIEATPDEGRLYERRAEAWSGLEDWKRVAEDCLRRRELQEQKEFTFPLRTSLCLSASPYGPVLLPAVLPLSRRSLSKQTQLLLAMAHDNLGRPDLALDELTLGIRDYVSANDFHALRGTLHARAGRFVEACADFKDALDKFTPKLDHLHALAVTQLALKDGKGYRKTCARMLEKYDTLQDPFFSDEAAEADQANLAAWMCVLTPDAVSSWSRIVGLATEAVKTRDDPNTLNTLGAALHRAGRHKEAIARLQEGMAKREGDKEGVLQDWIFLALAHHKLDPKSPETRRWRDRAEKRLQDRPDPAWTWRERVEFNVLGRELADLGR